MFGSTDNWRNVTKSIITKGELIAFADKVTRNCYIYCVILLHLQKLTEKIVEINCFRLLSQL